MHTKSYGLDLLRIISSLLVFIPHIVISLSKDPALVKNSFIISILGVEIFFCLSGFLICKYGVSIIKSSKYMFLNSYVFVIRRVGRTWPAYFFALVSYMGKDNGKCFPRYETIKKRLGSSAGVRSIQRSCKNLAKHKYITIKRLSSSNLYLLTRQLELEKVIKKRVISLYGSSDRSNRRLLIKPYNLTNNIKRELKGNLRFVVFHDAYQYFEKRFGINILGAFTVNTDVMPGAEQLAEIREVIEHDKVSCIFSEPQFNPDIIKAVAKDTNIATGVIDPLGATLNPGKDLYFDLIGNMSKSFKGC